MTPLLRFLLPLCIVFALPVFGCSQALELVVKAANIEVDSGMISLSDIASVYSTNRNMVRQVEGLDLDEIRIGQSIEISKKQIRMRVRLANSNFDSITIRGPEKVVVKRVQPGGKLAKARSLIIQSIVNQFGIEKKNVQVDINEPSFAKIRWDSHEIDRSTVLLPTELPLGKTKARFVYDDESNNELEWIVDCRISVMTQMLVATRNLGRGVAITGDDFKVVKRPLSDRQIVPASKMDLVGRETTAVIPVHGIIRLSNLTKVAKRNLVTRNDVVDIVFTRGALKLRVKNAKVLTAGAKGDRVEVLNPTSQKRLVASVVSESLVEIR